MMRIAIWGAGKFGHYIKEQLDRRKDITLIGFIDQNVQLHNETGDLQVMTLLQAREENVDIILIAVVNFPSVIQQLKQEDTDKIAFIKEEVYTFKKKLSEDIFHDNSIVWLKDIDISKPWLRKLETNIMDSCNLNCRGCSHFSNLFVKGAHIPYDRFCKDLKQIAENINVVHFYLLGGEALLNERLTEYIDFSRQTLPYAAIEIVSNGILLQKQPAEFFECCRKNNILISISGYKPTLFIKENIENVLKKNNVEYLFREDVLEFGKNIDLQGRADLVTAAAKCRESDCHFFRNGRLYKCPFEALGNYFFNYYDIDIQFNGGVDVYDSHLDWNEVVKRLENVPVDACKYCGEEERVEWKIENEPKLEDWTVSG